MSDAAASLQELLEQSPVGWFLLSDAGELVYANPALSQLLGRPHPLPQPIDSSLEKLFVGVGNSQPRLGSWIADGKEHWLQVQTIPLGMGDYRLGSVKEASAPPDVAAQRRLADFQAQQATKFGFRYLPARSEIMRRVLHQVKLAMATDEPVTILGETGTGKQTLAKVIHYQRQQSPRGFVLLDCAALTPEIQRQQLLGRLDLPDLQSPLARGLLRAPGVGTLCISSPSLLAGDLQTEIVAAVEKEWTKWRIITSERIPLETARADGRLTESFYCFISRLVITLPPLRERLPELRDYVQLILEECAAKLKREALTLEPNALELFLAYDWPGNLHELQAVLEDLAIRVPGDIISAKDLPRRFHEAERNPIGVPETLRKPPPLTQVLEEVERRMLRIALEQNRGNKSKAAEFLSISRARFLRRIEQLGILGHQDEPAPPPKRRGIKRRSAKRPLDPLEDIELTGSGEKGD